jgi:hypothetical protein
MAIRRAFVQSLPIPEAQSSYGLFVDYDADGAQGPVGPTGSSIYLDVAAYAPAGTATDGTVDWRPYIQAAIDDANAGAGGVVHLPAGIYKVGYGVHVKSNVWLRGSGIGATTLKLADAAALGAQAIIEHLGAVVSLYNSSFARVSDMSIDGNRANNTDPVLSVDESSHKNGVYIGGRPWVVPAVCHDCVVEDLYVTEAASEGIEVLIAENCTVRRCYSANHGTGGGTPYDANAVILSTYTKNCHIVDCAGWGCTHGGLELFSGAGDPQYRGGCTIERSRTDNIIVNTSGNGRIDVYARIVDNHVDTSARLVGGHGIVLIGCPSFLLIEGNTIRHTDGLGIYNNSALGELAGSDDGGVQIVIVGNVIERIQDTYVSNLAGITLSYYKDAVLIGNQITGHGGIGLTNCAGVSVTGNTMVGAYGAILNYFAPNDGSREGASPMDPDYHPRYGMTLVGCRECVVSENTIRGFNWSALTEDPGVAEASKTCKRNLIANNNLYNNWLSELTTNNRAPTSIWSGNILRPYP